ncbi:2-amino-4-hydroxy-6-hydroxymethyldihydropteridine diphosphokinase [Acidaminococcus massiliensis]|uniref:2-amino-4-hydroxy-6- hydroxymethyldihydropteridine diphosphokinase n=1 Tax=Acidaminococcus massiliensis TaxID=1852375 RepID=UPI00094E564C|nr:2-amino-4-hydroxy-6-hydroxymethyldihydropteridine diphosphokinase [Acidaminococcus massiliensis]
MSIAYVALGSNLGDKEQNIRRALELMEQHGVRVRKVSPLLTTEPYGVTDQPEFLNDAAEVEWAGDAESLLHTLLAIEQEMGRQRKRHWGERNIDLDLLLFGDQILRSADLVLPHPDMANRSFVLEPLAAIAETVVHPVFHRTIGELWQALQEKQQKKGV